MKLLVHNLDDKDFKAKFSNINKDTTVISSSNEIHHCIGCFGCWVKTPAACVIRDKYGDMGELLSKCEELVIISKCCYGGFEPFVKNVMDRSISYIHPYFTTNNKEMHHRKRYKNCFSLKVCFYGTDIDKEEMETAKKLVVANSINLHCTQQDVFFFSSIEEMDGKII